MGYGNRTRAAFIQHATRDDEWVYVFGEVDTDTERDFRDALNIASQAGRRVIVDLTRCTYIGSQGFAALFDARTKMLIGVIAPPRIRQLLQILELSDIVVERASDVAVEQI
jgi:anti-anti-sigma regulatory factor